jgi:hypothetical protein
MPQQNAGIPAGIHVNVRKLNKIHEVYPYLNRKLKVI